MVNVDMKIRKDKLVITIDLSQEHGLSRSGRSQIIGSTQGNIPIIDGGRYRDEVLNLNLTRKVKRDGS